MEETKLMWRPEAEQKQKEPFLSRWLGQGGARRLTGSARLNSPQQNVEGERHAKNVKDLKESTRAIAFHFATHPGKQTKSEPVSFATSAAMAASASPPWQASNASDYIFAHFTRQHFFHICWLDFAALPFQPHASDTGTPATRHFSPCQGNEKIQLTKRFRRYRHCWQLQQVSFFLESSQNRSQQ